MHESLCLKSNSLEDEISFHDMPTSVAKRDVGTVHSIINGNDNKAILVSRMLQISCHEMTSDGLT